MINVLRQPRGLMLLDYDGVLVDSKALASKIFIQALNNVEFFQVTSVDEVVSLCDGNAVESLVQMGMTLAEVNAAYVDYGKLMESSPEKAPLFPGVREAIQELYPDYYLHIVTSSNHALVASTMDENKVPWIDGIWGVDDQPSKVKKINNLKAMYPGLPVFFLGDTRGDMVEAREAQAVPIAATWGWHDRERLERGEPDYYLDSISELPALLAKLMPAS